MDRHLSIRHRAASPPPKLYLWMLVLAAVAQALPPPREAMAAVRNATDLRALISFKAHVAGDDAALGALSSWNETNTTLHFCAWSGVVCGAPRHPNRVTALSLPSLNLTGTLSPYLANLSFLRQLDLSSNRFHGLIPWELGSLSRLQRLNLSYNSLEGDIPVALTTRCSKLEIIILESNNHGGPLPANFSHCRELNTMGFSLNQLSGTIPASLGSLPKLSELGLGSNHFSGGIPGSLGNLSSTLTFLDLAVNNLEGPIDEQVGRLSGLEYLALTLNKFTGEIPPSLFNLSSLYHFSVGGNYLTGALPRDVGFTLPRLQIFYVTDNQLGGMFPASLTNASGLQEIDLSGNKFTGPIPGNLGSLSNLITLQVYSNRLDAGGWIFLDSLTNCSMLSLLDLADNDLQGPLPRSVANLSVEMTILSMSANKISGTIPTGMERLTRLVRLYIDYNNLIGAIPATIGNLPELIELDLSNNHFQGQIPSSIGNITQLNQLDLNDNELEGSIPTSMANLVFLSGLDLSYNKLSGSIPGPVLSRLSNSLSRYLGLHHNMLTSKLPPEVGSLINLNWLAVSGNRLSGTIPASLGGCLLLEHLSMQGNLFEGDIPTGLRGLKGITEMDLSDNNLSGPIPKFIENFRFLYYLNLSFNDLEGQVPLEGVFGNATAVSLLGNNKLCGGHRELNLQPCNSQYFGGASSAHAHKLVIVAVVVALIIFLLSMLAGYYYLWKRKKKMTMMRQRNLDADSPMEPFARISYNDIYNATDGFSSSNLIGTGAFGSVYKGIIMVSDPPPHPTVAIKVLNLEQAGAAKTFIAECNILRAIRHRNLVKIITACSSVDRNGNDFKALIMEYMSNGNSDVWLHANNSTSLNLLQRWHVMMDVARALDYLHNHCQTPIVHCDLKPSNILFDHDMGAHVADFGLSRFLHRTTSRGDDHTNSTTSDLGIKGSIGYIAPEYGMGGPVTTEGDMYSYGVLLLETFTGKRPMDDIFQGDLDLHKYVEMAYPDRVLNVVDPSILTLNGKGTGESRELYKSSIQKCMSSIMRTGLACSNESPSQRMKVEDVIKELLLVKEDATD